MHFTFSIKMLASISFAAPQTAHMHIGIVIHSHHPNISSHKQMHKPPKNNRKINIFKTIEATNWRADHSRCANAFPPLKSILFIFIRWMCSMHSGHRTSASGKWILIYLASISQIYFVGELQKKEINIFIWNISNPLSVAAIRFKCHTGLVFVLIYLFYFASAVFFVGRERKREKKRIHRDSGFKWKAGLWFNNKFRFSDQQFSCYFFALN